MCSSKRNTFGQRDKFLPSEQRNAVKACFSAAKLKSPRGRRYDLHWIYECLLMRIKSKNLYEHILNRKILIVPTVKTLDKYIKKMNSSYGFNMSTFASLKKNVQL